MLSLILYSSLALSDVEPSLRWNSTHLNRPIVDIQHDKEGRIWALDTQGQVYRTSKSGRWVRTLVLSKEGINEEDLLLDAESTMGEVLEGIETTESYVDEETEETIIEEGQDTFDDELQGSVFDPLRDTEHSGGGSSLHVSNSLVVVCVERCIYSDDLGRSWHESVLPMVHDVAYIDSLGIYLAATASGLWQLKSNGRWSLHENSFKNMTFWDIEQTDLGWYLAGESGVFSSLNTVNWNRVGVLKNIQKLSYINNVLYLADSEQIYFMSPDDGSLRALHNLQTSFQDMREIDNRLWVLTSTEIFRLHEGSWILENHNLMDKRFSSFLSVDGQLLLATQTGVFQLAEQTQVQIQEQQVSLHYSLSEAVALALEDIDQRGDALSIQNPLMVGALAPVLSISGEFDRNLGISVDYGSIASVGQEDVRWKVGLNLCFGRCASVASSSISSLQEEELMVVNGSVFSQGGVAAAASSLEVGLHQQRKDRSEQVISLYQSHRQLLLKKKQLASAPLLDQSYLELELAQVIAQLDILTQGRYSAPIKE